MPDEFRTRTVLSGDGQTLYTVRLGDSPSCTCRGFQYRRRCKHIEQLQGESQVTQQQQPQQQPDPAAVARALSEPFDRGEVKFKPQAIKGNKALAVAYIDARCVMDRLDEVVGPCNWTDSYDRLDDGGVVCTLRVRIGGEWVTHQDVGAYSEQPDEDDRRKAAFSDALKRAAVKFGIGRYLYRGAMQWVDYDPQKKRFTGTPRLPGDPPAPPAQQPQQPALPAQQPQQAAPPAVDHAANVKWVRGCEARLVARGACRTGDLVEELVHKLGGGWQHEPPEKVKAEAIAIGKWFVQATQQAQRPETEEAF